MTGQVRQGVAPFYVRSAIGRALVAIRAMIGRDRAYRIGQYPVVLPAAHKLPWFQRVFPTYDRYASDLLESLCHEAHSPLMVDIGANVGDTALLALDAVHNISVVSVEGDKTFLVYLRKNTAQVEARVTIIPSFLEMPNKPGLAYHTDGSTGGFAVGDAAVAEADVSTVSADEVLSHCGGHDLVIWKTDTDGLDVSLLLSSWRAIDLACHVVWFELDPVLDVEEGRHVIDLAQAIAASGRTALIFDNTGRHMMTVEPAGVVAALSGLTRWLVGPGNPGQVTYLDVWAVRPEVADGTHLGSYAALANRATTK